MQFRGLWRLPSSAPSPCLFQHRTSNTGRERPTPWPLGRHAPPHLMPRLPPRSALRRAATSSSWAWTRACGCVRPLARTPWLRPVSVADAGTAVRVGSFRVQLGRPLGGGRDAPTPGRMRQPASIPGRHWLQPLPLLNSISCCANLGSPITTHPGEGPQST
jgi:hypothetical protein